MRARRLLPDGSWRMLGDGTVRVYRPDSHLPERHSHCEAWRTGPTETT
ncbi:MAG: hypothetical protein WKH64_03390 [Chloroflexia bacterium]